MRRRQDEQASSIIVFYNEFANDVTFLLFVFLMAVLPVLGSRLTLARQRHCPIIQTSHQPGCPFHS